MISLTREVRFSVDRDWSGHIDFSRPITNSWAGWPSAVGIVPYVVLRATVRGTPDATTGYLCNIKTIDALLRRHAIPHTARALEDAGWRLPAEQLLRDVWNHVRPHAEPHAPVVRLELLATPVLRYAIDAREERMIALTQQFEFAAAHRLHCDALSAEENRRVFGKCNNANGHGHNYRLEVTIAGEPDARSGVLIALPEMEQTIKRRIIDRFDHKHLNHDCAEFADLNPSVENIARVIWTLLRDAFAPARLQAVRVWETAKTWAEYAGEES